MIENMKETRENIQWLNDFTYMWQALNLVASELAVGTDGSDVVGVVVVSAQAVHGAGTQADLSYHWPPLGAYTVPGFRLLASKKVYNGQKLHKVIY